MTLIAHCDWEICWTNPCYGQIPLVSHNWWSGINTKNSCIHTFILETLNYICFLNSDTGMWLFSSSLIQKFPTEAEVTVNFNLEALDFTRNSFLSFSTFSFTTSGIKVDLKTWRGGKLNRKKISFLKFTGWRFLPDPWWMFIRLLTVSQIASE